MSRTSEGICKAIDIALVSLTNKTPEIVRSSFVSKVVRVEYVLSLLHSRIIAAGYRRYTYTNCSGNLDDPLYVSLSLRLRLEALIRICEFIISRCKKHLNAIFLTESGDRMLTSDCLRRPK